MTANTECDVVILDKLVDASYSISRLQHEMENSLCQTPKDIITLLKAKEIWTLYAKISLYAYMDEEDFEDLAACWSKKLAGIDPLKNADDPDVADLIKDIAEFESIQCCDTEDDYDDAVLCRMKDSYTQYFHDPGAFAVIKAFFFGITEVRRHKISALSLISHLSALVDSLD